MNGTCATQNPAGDKDPKMTKALGKNPPKLRALFHPTLPYNMSGVSYEDLAEHYRNALLELAEKLEAPCKDMRKKYGYCEPGTGRADGRCERCVLALEARKSAGEAEAD